MYWLLGRNGGTKCNNEEAPCFAKRERYVPYIILRDIKYKINIALKRNTTVVA